MLHYTTHVISDTADWVTFIHGAGGSSNIWYKQLRDFGKKFNILLIDLRGHGKSKNCDKSHKKRYTFSFLGNDVIEVLDYLKIEKTHFVGISLGTIIIRDISERHPNRIKSMILGGAIMKLNIRGQVLMRLGFIFRSTIPYMLLYKLFAFIIMPRKTHSESRNLFVREAKKLYQKEFMKWFRLTSEVNPLLSFFRIKESAIPTFYIMGAEDHMFLPSIKRLVEKHRSSKIYVVPNCGHVVNVEQPSIFNRVAVKFALRHSF